ncbi:MAG: MFS transporter [Planctomycetes bacterium]|nr:MFS transporter [Planctomycetota bacterium]
MQDPQNPLPNDHPAASTATPKSNKAAMMIVFLVVFIDLLGFGIVLPLLPRYAETFMPPGQSNLVVGLVIGFLMSSFSAMQFIFAPIWGRYSDRVGRRPVLIIGLAGSVVFYALFGLASELDRQSLGWLPILLLLGTRIGAGVCGATISTAAAVIADSTSKEKRSHGMALIGAAFGIGFTFGPLIAWAGIKIFPNQYGGPGYLAAILSAVALYLAIKKMPETLPPGGSGIKRSWLDMNGLLDTLRTPTVGLLVFAFFLTTFAFASFEGTLSLLNSATFKLSNDANYLIFAYVGFVLVMTQGFIYRRLVKKMDELKLMRIGIIAMLLGLASLAGIAATATSASFDSVRFAWFLFALAISVFGFAFLNPSLNGLISRRSDPSRQGEVLGINQSFSALARILGPTIGMVLFTVEESHVLPYAMSAAILALVLVLMSKIKPS